MKSSFLFLALFVLILNACKKEHLHGAASLEFKIKKPTPSQVFNKSEPIEMEFEASSDTEIHGYEFRILQLPQANVLKIQNEHVHYKKLEKSYTWVPADTLSGLFQWEVTVFLDHEGNKKVETVNFSIRDYISWIFSGSSFFSINFHKLDNLNHACL